MSSNEKLNEESEQTQYDESDNIYVKHLKEKPHKAKKKKEEHGNK